MSTATANLMAEKPILLPLLRADPHRWGAGLVHQIDREKDQTLCGRTPVNCPGSAFYATPDQITCRRCLRSIEAREKSAQFRAEWEQKERERSERDRLWRQEYAAYLLTPAWRSKRARVLERANGRCEGCGDRRATQVHHRRYPQGCSPGSQSGSPRRTVDLIAICDGCHTDVHGAYRR